MSLAFRAASIGRRQSRSESLARSLRETVIAQMKPELKAPPQEALAGLVERVTFHDEENGFCVLRTNARGRGDLVTVTAAGGADLGGRVDHSVGRMDQ